MQLNFVCVFLCMGQYVCVFFKKKINSAFVLVRLFVCVCMLTCRTCAHARVCVCVRAVVDWILRNKPQHQSECSLAGRALGGTAGG